MSRISLVAASAAFALLVSAVPAQAVELERVPAGPTVGDVVDGGAQTQVIWTWLCQALGMCK